MELWQTTEKYGLRAFRIVFCELWIYHTGSESHVVSAIPAQMGFQIPNHFVRPENRYITHYFRSSGDTYRLIKRFSIKTLHHVA
jgi:hypothetical protein